MKIAFLVLNHRPPEQLVRLLGTLRQQLPNSPLVVHHDRFRENLPFSALASIDNVHLITGDGPIIWGDFSVLWASLRSIEWVVNNIDFDWLIMLSAQDYPIKPLSDLSDYLKATGGDALLQATQISQFETSVERRDMRRRYLYQYGPAKPLPRAQRSGVFRRQVREGSGRLIDLINLVQPFMKIYRLPDDAPYRVGWRAAATPFSRREPCWWGDARFNLSRCAAEHLISTIHERPEYLDYYRRTIMPAESAPATVICNAPGLRVTYSDLHHVRWTARSTGHPDIFTIDDLAELMASPKYFARKFDIGKDARILDGLDEILRKSGSPSGPFHHPV